MDFTAPTPPGTAPRRRWPSRTVASAVAAVAVASGASFPAQAQAGWLDQLVGTCPTLYVLAVQGTGESSENAPVKADTGMLSRVLAPLLEQARVQGVSVDRAYVPYPAGFGGAVPGGHQAYTVSVAEGAQNLRNAAERVLAQCPGTKLAIAGYSQGAHAASGFLREVGGGGDVVPSSAVAAGALFGSPTRAEASGVFPGTTSNDPAPVPGTGGEAVRELPAVSFAAPRGAGIGPVADIAASYGSLTGRVASWCQLGDLACDAPPNAPVTRAVANVASQVEVGGDPFLALETIGRSLSQASFSVVVDTVNEDVRGTSVDKLSLEPQMSMAERFAAATAPGATPPTGQEVLAALTKVGLIAANAVSAVARKVLTAQTIAEVAAVGLANPAAAFAILAAKTAGAVADLVPPTTAQRLVRQTFDIVRSEVEANRDLFDLSALAAYRGTVAAHGSYASVPVTAAGLSPVEFVTRWLAAVAKDLADSAQPTAVRTTGSSTAGPATATTTASTTTTTTVPPSTTVPTAVGTAAPLPTRHSGVGSS